MEPHSNQATPKYIGYVYQVLIAIEQCLIAKPNQTIWIECYGDVYDGSIGTEVKHHIDEHFLIDNSTDFWNTLKNWVTEDISEFQELVLHTTSKIRVDSIFDGWNDISKTKRYNKLIKHQPSSGLQSLYDEAFKCSKKELISILDKITIKHSQKPVQDKWEELINHRMLLGHIPEQYREEALCLIYGYINKAAINNHKLWNIKINDFDRIREISLRKFTQEHIPFPSTSKTDIDTSNNDFSFVKEMEEISLRTKPIQAAVSDYLRAGKSQLKMITLEPGTMPNVLDEYDETVLGNVENIKDQHACQLNSESLETVVAKQASSVLYYAGINNPNCSQIPRVDTTPEYYQRGRIHHNIEERNFSWIFTKNDIV